MTYRAVRHASDPNQAQRLIAEALPSLVASVMQPTELEAIQLRLRKLPEPPPRAQLSGSDWRGALGVFLFVFLSTFPVAVPFIFMQSARTAMRVSNVIAIGMLFFAGVAYGRCVGRSPWGFGISMVLLGGVLVAITIALGG
jgi:VIT1/CCC1 family predicted Fe2+/Mn2+ transporter